MSYLVEKRSPLVEGEDAICSQAITSCPYCELDVVTFTKGATRHTLRAYHIARCPQTPPAVRTAMWNHMMEQVPR